MVELTNFRKILCIFGEMNILHVTEIYLSKTGDGFQSSPVLMKYVAVVIHYTKL